MMLAIRNFPRYGNVYHYQRESASSSEAVREGHCRLRRTIEREPTKASHYTHRGKCWQALGDEEKAAADFEMAKKLGEK